MSLIAGRPAFWWIQLWRRCHELKWAGKKIAYWSRLEWPEEGSLAEQNELMVQIFTIITDQKTSILVSELKK